jgi:hypothetical protein
MTRLAGLYRSPSVALSRLICSINYAHMLEWLATCTHRVPIFKPFNPLRISKPFSCHVHYTQRRNRHYTVMHWLWISRAVDEIIGSFHRIFSRWKSRKFQRYLLTICSCMGIGIYYINILFGLFDTFGANNFHMFWPIFRVTAQGRKLASIYDGVVYSLI